MKSDIPMIYLHGSTSESSGAVIPFENHIHSSSVIIFPTYPVGCFYNIP